MLEQDGQGEATGDKQNGQVNVDDPTQMTPFEINLKDERWVAAVSSHSPYLISFPSQFLDFLQTCAQVPGRLQAAGGRVWLLLLQEPHEGISASPAGDQRAAGRSPAHDPQHHPLPGLLQRPAGRPGRQQAGAAQEPRAPGETGLRGTEV